MLAQSPLVSIIMPAFKSEAFITRAVNSVLEQSYPHWELLLISDDRVDYQALLKEKQIDDPRIRFAYSDGYGTGPNATRNIGLALAKGELIAPLDSDDYYYPERLENLVPLAMQYGVATDNVDVCENDSGDVLYRPFEASENTEILSLANILDLSTPLLLVFKRELVTSPWNDQVILGEDTLFNLRIIEAAGQLYLNRWPMHAYCVHDQSICHRPDAAKRAEQAYTYCIEQISTNGLGFKTAEFREAIHNMLQRKRELNRRYNDLHEAGLVENFQDFIASFDQQTNLNYGLAT